MSRKFTFSNLDHFDALERKLSMSAMAGSLAARGLPLCGTTFPRPTPSPILARSRALLGPRSGRPRRSAWSW